MADTSVESDMKNGEIQRNRENGDITKQGKHIDT